MRRFAFVFVGLQNSYWKMQNEAMSPNIASGPAHGKLQRRYVPRSTCLLSTNLKSSKKRLHEPWLKVSRKFLEKFLGADSPNSYQQNFSGSKNVSKLEHELIFGVSNKCSNGLTAFTFSVGPCRELLNSWQENADTFNFCKKSNVLWENSTLLV